MTAPIRIKKGSILVYRIFDVAEEISIPKVEAILHDSRGPDRFKVPKYIDKALVMRNRPVSFGLGEELIRLNGRDLRADVLVKIRDFGTLSLLYQINMEPGTPWQDLVKLAIDLEEGSEIDVMAQQQAREIIGAIGSALKKPSTWSTFEDYIIYFIEDFEDGINASDIVKDANIVGLLLAEEKIKLSRRTEEAIKTDLFQYGENDLTVIEWNSALVVEPGGSRDVPDILEYAVTQLMEMRFYDDLLDSKLNTLYDDIQKKKTSRFGSRYDHVYEDASSRYIEFIEFLEKVENSLKVVGDFYLATIYRAATRQFRLSDWQNSVTRKMNILAQVSNLLQGEINMRKSHWMEIIIILLIAYEIFAAFWNR